MVAACLGALLACLLVLTGCERCSRVVPLARLVTKSGDVQRDYARAQNDWQLALVGAEFDVGDAVKTADSGSAELALDDGSLLKLEAGTLVRFLDKKPGQDEQAVDLVTGAATLEAGDAGALLRTTVGSARLSAGGRLTLRRDDGGVSYKVLVGRARLESAQGARDVAAGQEVTISLGTAELEASKAEEGPVEPALPALAALPITAEVKGSSVSVMAPAGGQEVRLAPGTTALEPGSVLTLGKGSSVVVSQGGQTATLGAEGRYVIGRGGHLVSAERGEYTVQSEEAVRIEVPGGVIVTTGGAALFRREAAATSVTATSGTVVLQGKNRETLAPGESGRLTDAGQASVSGRGLSYADLELTAGHGLIVHDPTPPTAVRFVFRERCAEGVVRLKGAKAKIAGDAVARGRESVALAVGPGQVDYEVSCLDGEGRVGPVTATGKITVLADAGTRSVPEKAPSTFVDVNGRSYTVLYQNQLPQVTARWAAPPNGAEGVKLHVTSGGRQRTLPAAKSAYTFPSGALGEGTHTFFFEGGGRVSRKSSVTILFDNASPTVALQTPASTGVGPGGSLLLTGAALPGWAVTVDGRAIALDADGRFSVSANMPGDGRPLAVYLSHPARGSHVYLRRPAGQR